MDNIIIVILIAAIICLAFLYIYKSKKKGSKCVGCPYSSSCQSSKGPASCSCNSDK